MAKFGLLNFFWPGNPGLIVTFAARLKGTFIFLIHYLHTEKKLKSFYVAQTVESFPPIILWFYNKKYIKTIWDLF